MNEPAHEVPLANSPGPSETVRAAGGVVVRPGRGGPEVLLVHRPRYDDWSFPKGKHGGGETDEETARREVREETGYACHLGPELGAVRYVDGQGRPKVVRYWLMQPASLHTAFRPGPEVDELEWCAWEQAAEKLTYEHDRVLLRRAAEVLDRAGERHE